MRESMIANLMLVRNDDTQLFLSTEIKEDAIKKVQRVTVDMRADIMVSKFGERLSQVTTKLKACTQHYDGNTLSKHVKDNVFSMTGLAHV